jgi:hypothetical protein
VKATSYTPAVALLAAVFLAGAAPAFAQATGAQGASGGLFAGGDATPSGRHKLDFSLSAVEANDSDAPPDLRGATGDPLPGGYSTMFLGNMEYRWDGRRVQIAAGSASVLRRYTTIGARSVSHSAEVALTARLGPRTTLSAGQTAAYSPAYLYGLFASDAGSLAGDGVSAAPDYTVDDSSSYFSATTVALTRGLSRRSRVSVKADVQVTNFLHETGTRHDLDSTGVGGEYLNSVGRNTTVRVGYRYRAGRFGYAAATASQPNVSSTEQSVDVGVEYARPLSGTRQMVFGFNLGSTSLTAPGLTDRGAGASRLVALSGDGTVAWQFARSWQARGTLRRGPEYVAQLSEPVFVTGVSSQLSGLITSRIDVLAAAKYATGTSALDRDALRFDTYGIDLRARFALTRSLAVYGEYLSYYYDFQGAARLPTGIPAGLERNGLRAGFTLWVPALRR